MVVIRDRTEVVVSFTDFLLVAIHNILYERVICPSNLFLLARRYSLKFKQSRHPQVCEHIIRVVDAVKAELLTRMINAIAVLALDGDKLLERIVFDLSKFSETLVAWAITSMEGSQIEENNGDILPVTDVEEQYRGSLYRLSCQCAIAAVHAVKPVFAGYNKWDEYGIALPVKDFNLRPDERLMDFNGTSMPWRVPMRPALERLVMPNYIRLCHGKPLAYDLKMHC